MKSFSANENKFVVIRIVYKPMNGVLEEGLVIPPSECWGTFSGKLAYESVVKVHHLVSSRIEDSPSRAPNI
jgi:hypothetical protein